MMQSNQPTQIRCKGLRIPLAEYIRKVVRLIQSMEVERAIEDGGGEKLV